MKQIKLLLLLLLLLIVSILVFKEYNMEMSKLEMDTSDLVISDTGIELLEVANKDELLNENSSLKESTGSEELRICHDEFMKERNELFLSSIYDNTFGRDINLEVNIEDNTTLSTHKFSNKYMKERFVYTIWDTTIKTLNEFDNDMEKVNEEERIIDVEVSSDEKIEIIPEKLEILIKQIADHSELSAAEKKLTISSIRYGDKCPLECLDGYSEYKEEFFILNPTGYDEINGLTFEDTKNYYASYGKRVRDVLEQDKLEQ